MFSCCIWYSFRRQNETLQKISPSLDQTVTTEMDDANSAIHYTTTTASFHQEDFSCYDLSEHQRDNFVTRNDDRSSDQFENTPEVKSSSIFFSFDSNLITPQLTQITTNIETIDDKFDKCSQKKKKYLLKKLRKSAASQSQHLRESFFILIDQKSNNHSHQPNKQQRCNNCFNFKYFSKLLYLFKIKCDVLKIFLKRPENEKYNQAETYDDFYSIYNDNDEDYKSVASTITNFDETLLNIQECACENLCHLQFNPEMPLVRDPNVGPDSYEEKLQIANVLVGEWVTLLERSESLDAQYREIGLGVMKRTVMNRLRLQLTMFLEEENTILHCWIHTPLGIRHLRSNLTGKECTDDDPDAGRWTGYTNVVDYSIPWFCEGKPVRALQQTRFNPKVGKSVETRCVLPDKDEKKILLFSFVMYPNKSSERLSADRILKPMDIK